MTERVIIPSDVITHRTEMVLGREGLEALARTRVIVFGLGGVGSWCAEALARTGIGSLTVVDSDIICPTNINRQCQATSANTGEPKAAEMARRLHEINPSIQVTPVQRAYGPDTDHEFSLAGYDYVIDAIDSLASKLYLIERCLGLGVTIYSSMGAAAKTDPSRIRVARLSETVNCPLARLVRRGLKHVHGSRDLTCVYSDEIPCEPMAESLCGTGKCSCVHDRHLSVMKTGNEAVDWCGRKKRINGSLVHITGIFGFMLASLVINDAACRNGSRPA